MIYIGILLVAGAVAMRLLGLAGGVFTGPVWLAYVLGGLLILRHLAGRAQLRWVAGGALLVLVLIPRLITWLM